MHIRDLDIVVRVGIDVGIHTRLRFKRLQIVRVRLKHIRDETLHRIRKIYCHRNTPFQSMSCAYALFQLTLI